MSESEPRRSPHDRVLTSREIGASSGGPFYAIQTPRTPTPSPPQKCTLQFLISIIKKSQQGSPSRQSESTRVPHE